MRLVYRSKEGITSGIIVEAEAYIGLIDAASHAHKGKTPRNSVMFGPGGYAYVYLIYGMYYCFNVVAGKAGFPAAVLIRALEPVEGIPLMAERRGIPDISGRKVVNLTNGPGKLCTAMGIDRTLYGADLLGAELYLARPPEMPSFKILATPRINVDYSGEAAQYPWRFIIEGNKFVSK